MKTYKFWWYLAIVITVVVILRSVVFAGSTYIVRIPTGSIINQEDTTIYVNNILSGYMISESGHDTTLITKTPIGYIVDGENDRIHAYINLNGEEGEIELYYGEHHEDYDGCDE